MKNIEYSRDQVLTKFHNSTQQAYPEHDMAANKSQIGQSHFTIAGRSTILSTNNHTISKKENAYSHNPDELNSIYMQSGRPETAYRINSKSMPFSKFITKESYRDPDSKIIVEDNYSQMSANKTMSDDDKKKHESMISNDNQTPDPTAANHLSMDMSNQQHALSLVNINENSRQNLSGLRKKSSSISKSSGYNKLFDLQNLESLQKLQKLATNQTLIATQTEQQKKILKQVTKPYFNPMRLTVQEQNELLQLLDMKAYLHYNSFQ